MLELDCAHELAESEVESIRRLRWIVLDVHVLDAHALKDVGIFNLVGQMVEPLVDCVLLPVIVCYFVLAKQ